MSQKRARQARRQTSPEEPKGGGLLGNRRIWASAGVLALVVVLIAGIVAARASGPAEPVVHSGGEVISFSGEDPVTGKMVSLSDYTGTPVVINVWGSWCPGCIAEAEDLRRFAEDHPNVQVIGIDLQDTKSGAKEFYEDWKWTHPSVFDPNGEISFSLGLQGTPSTFFLNSEHRMVTRIVGETDYAGFVKGLEAALAET